MVINKNVPMLKNNFIIPTEVKNYLNNNIIIYQEISNIAIRYKTKYSYWIYLLVLMEMCTPIIFK